LNGERAQAPHRKRDKRQQDKRNGRSDDSDHSDGRYCARSGSQRSKSAEQLHKRHSRPGILRGDFKAAQLRLHA